MTFIATALARPGPWRASRSRAFASASAALTSASTTWAPWATRSDAMASPKPWAAPVTSATLPATWPVGGAPAATPFRYASASHASMKVRSSSARGRTPPSAMAPRATRRESR